MPVDSSGQYAPFLSYFKGMFFEENGLFYSLGKSLGGEMYGLFTYYLASPYNLIALLFSKEYMAVAFVLILTLKTASTGVTFFWYLNRRKEPKWTNLMFSFAYTFSACIITYGFNIMWIDSMILLPVVIAGIEDLIKLKKSILYIVALSLTLITNYYMGFLVCIFSSIYFIYKMILENLKPRKEILKKIGSFAFASIIAVIISAVFLLPSYLGIKEGRAGSTLSDYTLEDKNFEFQNIFSKFLPNSFNMEEIRNHAMPPLFCGTIINVLVILYFFNTKIKLKEKIMTLIVFAIFFVSFYFVKINLLWTLGNVPAFYIYRYAFCFVFMFIMVSHKSFESLSEIIKKEKIIIAVSLFLLTITFIELTMSTSLSMKELKENSSEAEIGYYTYLIDFYNYAYGRLKNEDNGIYRLENRYKINKNDSLVFGYNGVNFSGSTYSKELSEFLADFGYFMEHVMVGSDSGNTKTADMLLGIKYIMNTDKKIGLKDYEDYNLDENLVIYKNPYALSLGYAVNDKVLEKVESENFNVFEYQNKFVKNLTDLNEDIYIKHNGEINIKTENIKKDKFDYERIDENEEAKIIYEFEVEQNEEAYIYLLRFRFKYFER